MNSSEQDQLILELFEELYNNHKGAVDKFQYSKDIMVLYFKDTLNQNDIKNIELKIQTYIHKGWLMCGMAGYVINPKLFEGKNE